MKLYEYTTHLYFLTSPMTIKTERKLAEDITPLMALPWAVTPYLLDFKCTHVQIPHSLCSTEHNRPENS